MPSSATSPRPRLTSPTWEWNNLMTNRTRFWLAVAISAFLLSALAIAYAFAIIDEAARDAQFACCSSI